MREAKRLDVVVVESGTHGLNGQKALCCLNTSNGTAILYTLTATGLKTIKISVKSVKFDENVVYITSSNTQWTLEVL